MRSAPRRCGSDCLRVAGLSLAAVDDAGARVVSVRSLVSRPVPTGQLTVARGGLLDALFTVEWVPVPLAATSLRSAVVGASGADLAAGLATAGMEVRPYLDLAALAAAIEAGEPVPEMVLACAGTLAADRACPQALDSAGAGRAAAGQALGLVQQWLAQERLAQARLVLVTRGAVPAVPGDRVTDLAGAAVWGLARSAQSENPGRLILADLPAGPGPGPGESTAALAAVLGCGEPELAVRGRTVYCRRLSRPAEVLLTPPGDGQPWRLDSPQRARLTG